MIRYETKGTCSTEVLVELDGDTIKSVRFVNGCDGNTQGVARLAKGRKVDEVIELLKDIRCNGGPSCPMQLAHALMEWKQENG
ncbi:MAG: TIGR03905 family TSCPD domain-containing protein [Candidatus Excrementavichristensenella sp.]|jgi:uncharacterized protein (TIGR03905 family)